MLPLIRSLFHRDSKLGKEQRFLLAKAIISELIEPCQEYLDALIGPKMARFVNSQLLETREILRAITFTEQYLNRIYGTATVSKTS